LGHYADQEFGILSAQTLEQIDSAATDSTEKQNAAAANYLVAAWAKPISKSSRLKLVTSHKLQAEDSLLTGERQHTYGAEWQYKPRDELFIRGNLLHGDKSSSYQKKPGNYASDFFRSNLSSAKIKWDSKHYNLDYTFTHYGSQLDINQIGKVDRKNYSDHFLRLWRYYWGTNIRRITYGAEFWYAATPGRGMEEFTVKYRVKAELPKLDQGIFSFHHGERRELNGVVYSFHRTLFKLISYPQRKLSGIIRIEPGTIFDNFGFRSSRARGSSLHGNLLSQSYSLKFIPSQWFSTDVEVRDVQEWYPQNFKRHSLQFLLKPKLFLSQKMFVSLEEDYLWRDDNDRPTKSLRSTWAGEYFFTGRANLKITLRNFSHYLANTTGDFNELGLNLNWYFD